MRKFIQKTLESLPRLPEEQIHNLIREIASENDLLRMVLSSTPGGVIVTDTENRIIFINNTARRLLPLAPGDIMEELLPDAIRDPDISEMVRSGLDNQETIKSVDFTLDRGGRNLVLNCGLLPLVKEGKIQGNVFYTLDVTEKKSEEARLRRAEGLASLATMTAGVAHEIKNPLGSISIYIQLMQKMLSREKQCQESLEELRDYLSVINEEVDRLNSIVVNYLFAVRPIDKEPEITDINSLLREIIGFSHFELEENRIEVQWNLKKNLPEIPVDPKLLKQALLNMIKNAQQAMPLGGTLEIKTEVHDNQIVINLTDTGEGISDEVKTKIFEPYFTTKDSGTGLGLTLVYKIIKEHSGDIQVISREKEGTTFKIFLPIPQKEWRLISWQGEDHDAEV